jgi:Protein of unknown function (DUF2975)
MKPLGNKSLTKILSIILNVFWWLEWIGSGVLITVILATAFLKQNISLNFPLAFSSVTIKTVASVSKNAPPGILSVMNGNFYMPVDNNWRNILLLLAACIAVCSVFIIITYQLKLLFSSLSNNQPFDALNVLRIRNTGIWLIVLALLLFFSNIIINQFLQSHFTWGEGISLTYKFNISYLVAGIILIIIAEIFNEGVTLKEETNLTI